MAGYKGHLLGGAITSFLLYMLAKYYFSYQPALKELLIFFAIITCYSLLPDIDIASSKIRKAFMVVGLIAILTFLVLKLFFFSILVTLLLISLQFLHHRGFTHTIRAASLSCVWLLFVDPTFCAVAFGCYLSHLVLDRQVIW